MKLSYSDLLSPYPIYIKNVGGIISPKIDDIFKIGINTYDYYLFIISMDLNSYFSITNQKALYDELYEEQKTELNVFDLLITTDELRENLQLAYNFFIKEDVVYDSEKRCFLIKDNDVLIGVIYDENYNSVGNIINQRNYVKIDDTNDLSKIKSKKALKILEKIKKAKESQKKPKRDARMELGNIISSVANKHSSINMINIVELTVFQVWDAFNRLINNNILEIQSMSVATWGDKEKKFDCNSWFNLINNNN